MDRKLGSLEGALTFSDEYSPMLMVGVLRLEHPPSLEVLRAALLRLQRRHPVLRARIARRRGRLCFEALASSEIPLESIDRRDDEQWRELAERELNCAIDSRAGPLLRCSVLREDLREEEGGGKRAGSRAELVVTAHHAALDGVSMLRIFDEMLRDCAALSRGEELGAVVPEPPPPSLESLYPARLRGLGWLRRALSLMLRQALGELRYRWRTEPGAVARPGSPARCRVLPLTLPQATTRALLRRCRSEGVTLNSALQAAMLLTDQRRFHSGRRVTLRSMAFYDLRSLLDPALGCDQLACYMSMSAFEVDLPAVSEQAGRGAEESRASDAEHAGFWSLTRAVQRAIRAAADRGDVVVTPSFLKPLMRAAIASKSFRMTNTALSYSGALPLAESYGEIGVRGLHGFISNHTLGPEYSGWGHLFRGELHLDALYLDADTDCAGAAELIAETRAILEGIAEPLRE